ncbi:MAG: DUF2889 domain-containing protein, partial [Proteobacteria bacterium]|nr:DUF2889 domain-containing protein [Pseudomonadota bacterium]
VDPWYEMRATLTARPLDYRIEGATIEINRTPGGLEGARRCDLDELRGAIAYLGIGKRIKTATEGDSSGLQAGLLMECAKALRQARVFVWSRIGVDPADHFELIKRILDNSCVYFTTSEALRSVLRPVQLQEMRKWDVLFSRHRYCLMQVEDGLDRVTAGLSDSYHEMSVSLSLEGGSVVEWDGAILRAPHEECFLAPPATLHKLRGARVEEGPAAWEGKLAGPKGCAHLADLAREALASHDYWRRARGVVGLPQHGHG